MAKSRKDYKLNIIIGGKVDKSLSGSVGSALKTVGGLAVGMKAAQAAWNATKWIGRQTLDFAKESVEAAKTYESAMADVAKVVDGLTDETGRHTEAYTKMSKQILDLSTQVPKYAKDIAKIVEAAGQSNIESDQLVDFAEAAVKMSVAFDTTAEQAGQWMAVWRTSMNLTQPQVEALADQVNYLGNTSSENALKISQVVTETGSLGKIAGLSAGEVAALAAATTGVDASSAATGIKNLVVSMSSGTAATKKQKTAFDKLGISTTQLAKRMQTDAQGAILDTLDAINKLPGSEQTAVIKDIFGKTSLETVAKLAGNVDNLREQLDKINDPKLFTGSMEKEFAARSATYENQLQLWQNTLDKFKINTGEKLLEKLNEASKTLLPEIDAALDDISPKIDDIVESIDVTEIVGSIVDMIPTMSSFITDTVPLLPGAVQTALTLANDLLPVMQAIVGVIETATAGIALLTGNARVAEAISDKRYGEKVAKINASMSSGQKAAQKAQVAKRAASAVGATGTVTKTAVPYTGLPQAKSALGTPAATVTKTTSTPKKSSHGGAGGVQKFAAGGIVTKPTFAMIGEGGEKEAVIPLSKLNAMLSGKLQSNAMTVTYAPVITVENGDKDEVEAVMQDEYGKFKRFMEQYSHERTRLKF